jgi:ATP-dependent Clp protease ATP-binding subunit ClpC
MDAHSSVQLTWALANRNALLAGSPVIESVHFLLALLEILDDAFKGHAHSLGLSEQEIQETSEQATQAQELLGLADEEVTSIRRGLRKAIIPERLSQSITEGMLHRSNPSRFLFIQAVEDASSKGLDQVTLQHLAQALKLNIPPEAAKFFEGRAGYRQAEPAQTAPFDPNVARPSTASSSGRSSVLQALGRDLTALARQGDLPPVIGRTTEMTALARYLMRTTKRNIIVIGPAGVGKTAVIMGLAQRLCQSNAPEFLRSLRLVQINVGDLVAGTRYRGDMEERLRLLVDEASSDPNLVLFLDEIHLVMKSGGDSPMDIANLLKTALERDKIRCIGATTTEEYEKYIKEDPAFLRRFQVIRLKEPNYEEALTICKAWAGHIEKIQGVHFQPEAIEAAVSLSMRLLRERSLPDKAIDLMENAATYVKVSSLSFEGSPTEGGVLQVTVDLIRACLEDQYGIPADATEAVNLPHVESYLRTAMIGQDQAVNAVIETLSGLLIHPPSGDRPMAIFLLTGPTGVGKTFLAESLEQALFGTNSKRLLRLNMNEYKETHNIARLTGADPGFIGHDRLGLLFAFTSENARGVILLDEIEKAHPEVHDYFLQIFDKGEATSARGQKADFRQHIIIMTCNLGAAVENDGQLGFVRSKETTTASTGEAERRALLRHFRPEFLGRIDRVIEMRNLRREDYIEMVQRQLDALEANVMEDYQVDLEITPEASEAISTALSSSNDGMRGSMRQFRQQVALPVMQHANKLPTGSQLVLDWVEGTMVLKP